MGRSTYPETPAVLDDVHVTLDSVEVALFDALAKLKRAREHLCTAYPLEAYLALESAMENAREAIAEAEKDALPVVRKLAELASEED